MNKKGQDPRTMTGIAMRGSVDISDIEKYPEANYWRMGARWAKNKLYEMTQDSMVDSDHVEDILNKFWKEENTWMAICLKTEHVLELLKALMNCDWSMVWNLYRNGNDELKAEIERDVFRDNWILDLPETEQSKILTGAPEEILLRVKFGRGTVTEINAIEEWLKHLVEMRKSEKN